MKKVFMRRLAAGIVGVGVVFGCNTVLNQVADEASQGQGQDGFARIDGGFSDAPVSPGGTGGVVDAENPEMGEETRSFFTAFQIDPEAEDSAGPKFVVSADIDQDGLTDLVSAWNQSQPIQLHLQRRDANGNLSFRTITIAGTTPAAVVAGVQVGQVNGDGFLDIVVLSKATGFATFCPPKNPEEPPTALGATDGAILVYFSPGAADLIPDGDRWTEMQLINPFISDVWIHDQFPGNEEVGFDEAKTKPEWNGFTSLQVANIDGVEGDDIVVALNPAECETLGQLPPLNTVDLWVNPGPDLAESPLLWGALSPTATNPTRRVPVALMFDAPQVKDIAVTDMDADGDLDVLATYTNSISLNLRWARNPLVAHSPGSPSGPGAVIAGTEDSFRRFASQWQRRPLGQVDTASDVIKLGDIDGDGFDDVVVRSTLGQIVQWFRHPNPLTVQPEFPPDDEVPDRFDFPWPVFTLTEFALQEPEAIAVGDVTGDGNADVLVAAEGGVFWFDGTVSATVYEPWFPNTIVEGVPPLADALSGAAPGSGVGVQAVDFSAHINWLLIVDLDADGRNDIVATLDRRTGAGLSDDRLVWYRNTRGEE